MNILIKNVCFLSWTKVDEFYDAYYFNPLLNSIHKVNKLSPLRYNFNFYKL